MKKIVRELRVSQKTVRKIIRTDETDFSYERSCQPQPRIGPWQDQLEQLLSSSAGKPLRERLTLIRISEELRGVRGQQGYRVSLGDGNLADSKNRASPRWSALATQRATSPDTARPGCHL